MGRCCSHKQLIRMLKIDTSQPQFIRLSPPIPAFYSYSYAKPEIHSSSLFDGFKRTTRRMSRFYRRTFSEHVPSSMLVRPYESYETDEAVHYGLVMGGLGDNDIKVLVESNKTVTIIGEGNGVFEATRGFKKYVCYIDLPDIDSRVNMYATRRIEANMMFTTGRIEIIIPKLKQHEIHEKPDDENVNEKTFNVKVNRTFYEDIYLAMHRDRDGDEDSDEDEDEECDCDGRHNFSLTRFYTFVRKMLF